MDWTAGEGGTGEEEDRDKNKQRDGRQTEEGKVWEKGNEREIRSYITTQARDGRN